MESNQAVRALAAIAQESRLAVYRLLVQQGPSGMAAGEIAAVLGIAPATLSFHLKELSHAGLVKSLQQGRWVFYSADFEAMNSLLAFLTENCCAADCGPSCVPEACKPAATKPMSHVPARTTKGVKT
jgi:DNA-binding transcriptional ArsR family regulator